MINRNNLTEKFIAKALKIDDYMSIIMDVQSVNVAIDKYYMTCFDRFYVVRRGLDWRTCYFEYFNSNKTRDDITFKEIITHMYKLTGNIEASFSSKMLATINPNMPIWDQYVLNKLKLKLVGKTKEEKLTNAIVLYDKIILWYKNFKNTEEYNECIEWFNTNLPSYSKINDVKKIDFILWGVGEWNSKNDDKYLGDYHV